MKVYTTGQVAKICKVVTATINHWFDKGMFGGGYRLPLGDRRIPRDSLIEFLKERGMPTIAELEAEEEL